MYIIPICPPLHLLHSCHTHVVLIILGQGSSYYIYMMNLDFDHLEKLCMYANMSTTKYLQYARLCLAGTWGSGANFLKHSLMALFCAKFDSTSRIGKAPPGSCEGELFHLLVAACLWGLPT